MHELKRPVVSDPDLFVRDPYDDGVAFELLLRDIRGLEAIVGRLIQSNTPGPTFLELPGRFGIGFGSGMGRRGRCCCR